MPVVIGSAFVALALSLIGFVVWIGLRIFKIRTAGRTVVKLTALGICVGVPLTIFGVAPILFSKWVSEASTRPWDQQIADTPETYGREYKEVRFTASDGLALSGWWLPGADTKVSILMSHGLFRNRQEILKRGCDWNEAGHPVLLFDLRNHGRSEHRRVTLGYQERLDFLGALDFLRGRQKTGRPVFYGVSMGAAAALMAAAEAKSSLTAVVADSPFLDLDETLERHTRLLLQLPPFPFAKIFAWNFCRLGNFDPDQLDTRRAARRFGHLPTLLLYGEDDRRMPPETARALLAALPAQTSRLVFFPGASHGDAYEESPDRYNREVLTFIRAQSESAGH